jgi:pyrroline-5-carboxylate reductase
LKTLGFIGTGTIASAFVEGLDASGKRNPIVVSPRSESMSRALAERLANVQRASSNAEVAEASDIVFLAMRPAQVEEALHRIAFRSDQIVCSFVTGLSVREVAAIAPAATVCRVLPLPAIAFGKGPVIHFPRVAGIVDLLEGMGEIVLPAVESELVAMAGVSGFMSTFFQLQATLGDWMIGHGVQPGSADTYARAIFSGLAETALRSPKQLADLTGEHETRGGLNERTRRALVEDGWFDRATAVIEAVRQIDRRALD